MRKKSRGKDGPVAPNLSHVNDYRPSYFYNFSTLRHSLLDSLRVRDYLLDSRLDSLNKLEWSSLDPRVTHFKTSHSLPTWLTSTKTLVIKIRRLYSLETLKSLRFEPRWLIHVLRQEERMLFFAVTISSLHNINQQRLLSSSGVFVSLFFLFYYIHSWPNYIHRAK